MGLKVVMDICLVVEWGYYPESEHFSLLKVWRGVFAWRVSSKLKGLVVLLLTS